METFDLRRDVSRRVEQLRPREPAEALSSAHPSGPGTERSAGAGPAGPNPADASTDAPLLRSMVVGIDDAGPSPLSRDQISAFGDFFTRNLILRGRSPLTLQALLDDLDALPDDVRLNERSVFVVAEGASLALTHPSTPLNARLVVVWRRRASTVPADLMLSTVPSLDDPAALLQLIAWSEAQGAFHFFERVRDGSGWVWAGNSFHALEGPSRGRGPFDSHVNGSLVLKELKFPWVHWNSMASIIPRTQVLRSEEVLRHELFRQFDGAEDLEDIVTRGIRRWTLRRLEHESVDGRLQNFSRYARQLVTTTTVNLVSSSVAGSLTATSDEIDLPVTFFLDEDGLDRCLGELTGEQPPPPQKVTVDGSTYADVSGELGLHVVDTADHRISGDTSFAFVVPERAFEDFAVVAELIDAQVLSPRLAICALMVDFPNPVFSPHRARLLRYFPDSAPVGSGGQQLDDDVVAAVRDAQAAAGSPEAEFLRWWDLPDLPTAVREAVDGYLTAVRGRLREPGGVRDVLRLAESRRQSFRRRPLAEFPPTTARLGESVPTLRMTEDADVLPATNGTEE